jgi:hypothetical protein
MTSVVLLWIALLHAFSLATASTPVRRDGVGVTVGAREERSTRMVTDVSDEEVRVPPRVSLRVAGSIVWSATPLAHGKRGVASLDARVHSLQTLSVRRRGEVRWSETHRLSSRGAVLPYYPTAPPRRT